MSLWNSRIIMWQNPARKPSLARLFLLWSFVALGVTFMGILFAYQTFVSSVNEEENPISWSDALRWQLEWWYLWLLLAPFILRWAKRFPIAEKSGGRNSMVHLFGAFLFSSLQTTLHTTVTWCTHEAFARANPFFKALLMNGLAEGNFQLGIIFYAVVVSIASAIRYYRIYQEKELKASRLEAELAQTRFQALKIQIYPHFLFHTLTHISHLMKENVESADRMITRLGDFLRLSMENIGTQEVTLQREIMFLKSYLEIEKIRLHDRFSYAIEMFPEVASVAIPNLLLQPLVESLLQDAETPGHISISARGRNGSLQFEVEKANGAGKPDPDLSSVRNRLYQLYGDGYQLILLASVEKGSRLTLEIPISRNREDAEIAESVSD